MDWYSARTDCERNDGQLYQGTTFPGNPDNCTDPLSRSYWVGLHLRLEMSLINGKLFTIVVACSHLKAMAWLISSAKVQVIC